MRTAAQIVSLIFLFGQSLIAAPTANFHAAPNPTLKLKAPFKPADAAARAAGAKLFAVNCAACHGNDAMGTGNVPALARGPAQRASEGELFWFITHGSPENGMPACKLAERERWQVVRFVKSLTEHPTTVADAPTSVATAPPTTAENTTDAPPPIAPFTDYRFEKPGQMHKILAKDLPAPAPETSSGNGAKLVPRPENAWPQVPPGFKVDLFASKLDNPRLLRTAPNGDIFLVESKPGVIRVFHGLTADGKPKSATVFATGLNEPYGLAFYPPGDHPTWIYVGNTHAVVRFAYQSGDLQARGPARKVADVPGGGGHWTRDLQFSLDGKKLFVAVGSVSNIDDPDTTPAEKNRADILQMTPEGAEQKIFASGIRNAGGGLAIQPKTGDLWCSVNERDTLGDNLVPDYITRVVPGGFYGWPWWYIGGHQDPRHEGKHPELREKLILPDVLLQPHHASLQLGFYEGNQFPPDYRGDIFAAQHGSWNRSVRTGYEVIRIPLHGQVKASGEYEDFMTGFVVDQAHVWGRPVGVTTMSDGSLLVSDDGSNSIWRVTYKP